MSRLSNCRCWLPCELLSAEACAVDKGLQAFECNCLSHSVFSDEDRDKSQRLQFGFDFEGPTTPRDRIQMEFEDYHKKHSNIRDLIEQGMMQRKRQGHNRVGMWLFFHQLMATPNWSMAKPGAFKHDYMSRYARLIMKENAELEGFFEIRPLKCEAGSVEVLPGRRGARHVRS